MFENVCLTLNLDLYDYSSFHPRKLYEIDFTSSGCKRKASKEAEEYDRIREGFLSEVYGPFTNTRGQHLQIMYNSFSEAQAECRININ